MIKKRKLPNNVKIPDVYELTKEGKESNNQNEALPDLLFECVIFHFFSFHLFISD
jgi:hypothetical protein